MAADKKRIPQRVEAPERQDAVALRRGGESEVALALQAEGIAVLLESGNTVSVGEATIGLLRDEVGRITDEHLTAVSSSNGGRSSSSQGKPWPAARKSSSRVEVKRKGGGA